MIRRLPGKRDGCEERQHKQHDGFRVVSSLDDETPKMVVSERLTDQRRAVSQTARRSRSAEGVAECYRASARTAAASASTRFASRDLVASWSSCVASDVSARREVVRSALARTVRVAPLRSAG